jgi:hypothetical protein
MATGRSSPSLVSYDRASSTAQDQTSFASDIELMALAPAVDNAVSEHSRQSSSVDLGITKRSTAAAVHPTRIQTASLRGDASSLQSDNPKIVRRLLLDSWLCECVAMCFSIGCLAAIAFVVGSFDEEKIPLAQLHSGLTLNAIISVLSNASRAGLIFVVSATMGQLKWCWLRKSGRRIQDIQAMDDASRGPLGAFGALILWTGGSLAALGSIITLMMIAFGPFLQQLVEYPSRNVTQIDAFASAPRNLAYTYHAPLARPDGMTQLQSPWEENVELLNALEAGVWTVPKPFDQEPICSTGECLWTEFQSVGWCSKCDNRTHSTTINNCKLREILLQLQEKDDLSKYCVLNLGYGANFSLFSTNWDVLRTNGSAGERISATGNFTSEFIWPSSYSTSGAKLTEFYPPGQTSNSTTLLGVVNPLLAVGHAKVKRDENDHDDADYDYLQVVEGSLCILNPCEKTLSLRRVNGTTEWKDVFTNHGRLVARNISFNDTEQSTSAGGAIRANLCWQADDGDLELDVFDEENYAVDNSKRAFCPVEDYAYNIQKSLQGRYDTTVTVVVDGDGHLTLDATTIRPGNPDIPWGYESDRFNTVGPRSTRNFSQRVESIAIALTNWGLQTTNDTWPGDAIAEESHVHVRWQWIALPAFLELASLALLVLTIIQSRRDDVPLWKSSALALIYHAVDELRGQETLATERLSSMEVTAKKTDVQLVKGEEGLNSLSKRSGYRPVDQDE